MKEGFLPYNIPILGLLPGTHEYEFQIGNDFFEMFEKSLVEDGNFKVDLILEKKTDMIILDFTFSGNVGTACDRCLASINLPVEGEHQLILKYGQPKAGDEEVVFIERDQDHYNVAEFIHEIIELGLPISNTYDCRSEENRPCDESILQKLEEQQRKEMNDENPLWDSLKNININ